MIYFCLGGVDMGWILKTSFLFLGLVLPNLLQAQQLLMNQDMFATDKNAVLNRDDLPGARTFLSHRDKRQVNAWLQRSGIKTGDEGFVDNLYHLSTGYEKPINSSMDFNVMAGPSLRMGFTFK